MIFSFWTKTILRVRKPNDQICEKWPKNSNVVGFLEIFNYCFLEFKFKRKLMVQEFFKENSRLIFLNLNNNGRQNDFFIT